MQVSNAWVVGGPGGSQAEQPYSRNLRPGDSNDVGAYPIGLYVASFNPTAHRNVVDIKQLSHLTDA